MKNKTELLLKAIKYEYPEEIPVSLDVLPATMKKYGERLVSILKKYPAFFREKWIDYDYEKDLPIKYQYGEYTDAWGCVWSNEQEGMDSYVTGHPLPNRSDILSFQPPLTDEGLPHGFMYLRILDLRGFEEAMIDFAEECDEIQILIDKICDYNIRQMEILCQNTKSPIIAVGDDLGMQRGIAIGADRWRKYLKPAFKRIYDVCRDYNKYVYMHSDGDIIEIMPDIIEVGVHIINPQYRANGIERLVKTCKGKIPIMLDLDRQLFPFGTPDAIRQHIRHTIKSLYLPEGGLGINIELGMDIPLENIEVILDEMNRMRFYSQ